MDAGAVAVLVTDGATAAAAAFNTTWSQARLRADIAAARRTALVTLALLNAGIALQALYSLALFLAHRLHWPADGLYAPGAWIASRALLLAGTLALSALILRRRAR